MCHTVVGGRGLNGHSQGGALSSLEAMGLDFTASWNPLGNFLTSSCPVCTPILIKAESLGMGSNPPGLAVGGPV